jgi:RNA polymerase sigma factor (sigma-70 family)
MANNLDLTDFFRWLDKTYEAEIRNYVKSKYPGLSPEDLDDVWAETKMGLLTKWQSDDGLDVDRDLGGLLRTIATRRACDLLRKRSKQDNLVDVQRERARTESHSEPHSHTGWWRGLDPVERQELQILVCKAFETLNPEQWMVLSVYCENYPAFQRPKHLVACLTEQFPEIPASTWPAAKVKRLLNQARTTVRNYLKDRGYDLDF